MQAYLKFDFKKNLILSDYKCTLIYVHIYIYSYLASKLNEDLYLCFKNAKAKAYNKRLIMYGCL